MQHRHLSPPVSRGRALTTFIAPLLLLLAAMLSGCSRPVRDDAVKVANAGSTAAKQMSEYFDTLSQDTIRTWELNAFSEGYGVAQVEAKFDQEIEKVDKQLESRPGDPGLLGKKTELEQQKRAALLPTPLDPARKIGWEKDIRDINEKIRVEREKPEPQQSKGLIRILEATIKQRQALINSGSDQAAIFLLYQQRYDALLARKQMATGLRSLYEQFARLASYNAVEDVKKKANDLGGALGNVLDTPIPAIPDTSGGNNPAPAPTANNEIVGALIGDIITELMVVQQNKAIRQASQRVIPALRHLSSFFDEEKVVYQSIPTLRASFSTQIAGNLVENSNVISTTLINDVLDRYELRWPEPQTPFTSKGMIRGIQGVIEARSKPLQKASQDTADKLSVSITQLVKLHEQLEKRKPLSLAEFAESSSTVQRLLEQLKAKGVPSEDVMEFLELLSKEREND